MHLPDPTFPPLLSGHPLRAPSRAFETAREGAASGAFSAGDVVWARATRTGEMAVVLEPDVPRRTALEMVLVAGVGLGDALGALLPSEVALHLQWPGTLRVNGALAGGLRLALPAGEAAAVPDWMVIGFSVVLAADPRSPEPGETPDRTSLAEEGGGDIDRTRLIESVSRHFLAWTHRWQDEGLAPVHESWFARAHARGRRLRVPMPDGAVEGVLVGLDDHGDALLRTETGTRALSLEAAMGACERAHEGERADARRSQA